MAIAILNKRQHTRCPYENWLMDINEEIVLFTTTEASESFKNKKNIRIEMFEQYNSNIEVEQRLIELNSKFNFSKIIALSESDILRAAKMREILGVEGQSYFSAEAFRNKIIMKQIAQENGIKTPQFQYIQTNDSIYQFIDKHGFPVVIKPIYGSGSEDTYVISSFEEVEAFILNSNLNIDSFQIETFVDGDMYHVDGLVCNGEIEFSCVSKYHYGCLSFKEGKPVSSYVLQENNPLVTRLNDQAEKLLKSLPTPKNTSFHAEFFYTNEDEIILCEIASRTGGGKIDQVINGIFGVNLSKLSVQSQCGIDNRSIIPKKPINHLLGFTLIPAKEGKFAGMMCKVPFDWVIEFDLLAKKGTHYEHAKHSVDYIATAIINGYSEEEVKARIDTFIQWMNSNMIWEI